MKLVIKSGESAENAVAFLQDFLMQHTQNYPMLKGDMIVSVSLADCDHRIFPDNQKEYILTGEEVIDVETYLRTVSFDRVISWWKEFVASKQAAVLRIEKCLDADLRYLIAAEEKGMPQDLIEERLKKKQRNQALLQQVTETYSHVLLLDDAFRKRNYSTIYLKQFHRSKPYGYDLDCYIVFESIHGVIWHFGKFGLQQGLPSKRQK